MGGYRLTTAYRMIQSVYGNHLHHNNGTHLDGGGADDVVWQCCWHHIGNLPMRCYHAPQGRVGSRFVGWRQNSRGCGPEDITLTTPLGFR